MIHFAASLFSFITSIYSLQFQDSNGATVNMSSFQGKKILLVNIATDSPKINQLAGLQQLQAEYGDSLVVIAFPSNSFGNESRSNAEIKQYCQETYGASFIIAAKAPVAGSGKNAVYQWLSSSADNGDTDLEVGSDFQKVLIAKDGSIQGVFSSKIEPMSDAIRNAISTSY